MRSPSYWLQMQSIAARHHAFWLNHRRQPELKFLSDYWLAKVCSYGDKVHEAARG